MALSPMALAGMDPLRSVTSRKPGSGGAVFEPPAVVAGLDDVAMMGQTVEQCGRHLGVAKNTRPFAECEIGCHDHRCLLIEPADQVEQQLSASLCERQIAELVEDDEILAAQIVGQASRPSGSALGLKSVDQINDIEESASGTTTNAGASNCDGEMTLPGTGPADQHNVALMRQEVAADQVAHQGLVDRRAVEAEVVDVLGQRQLGDGDLILDRTRLLLTDFGGQQITDDTLRFVL